MAKKILILRRLGGLGDILVHRMIFRDVAWRYGQERVIFACPSEYHSAVADHPHVLGLIDSNTADIARLKKLFRVFDTSDICRRHEVLFPRSELSRADIWAGWCGASLETPSMEFAPAFRQSLTQLGRKIIDQNLPNSGNSLVGAQTAIVAPLSANPIKDLLSHQVKPCIELLRSKGYRVLGLHSAPIGFLREQGVPVLTGLQLHEWMAIVSAADFVLSTDSAAFHMAGGLRLPVVGVFTWANAATVSKYYPSAVTVQASRDVVPCCPCANSYGCPIAGLPKPCLAQIAGSDVAAAINKCLARWTDRRGGSHHQGT